MNKEFRIIPDRRVLLLGHNPAVANTVPHAKTFMHNNVPLLAMPHKTEETRLLNNMGYDVPHPFRMYYEWGKIPPFPHQIDIADLMVTHQRGYILAEQGLGKTRGAIAAIDWLKHTELVCPVLIVCPLSIVYNTWAQEVFRWAPHLRCTVLYGPKKKRLELLKAPADIYVINFDGLSVIHSELLAKNFKMIVFDESTAFKNASTKRWKAAQALARQADRNYAMTGVFTPQSLMDSHGQIKLITPCKDVLYKTRFRSNIMVQVSQFKWVARQGANEVIHRLAQPAVRFAAKDCLTLPDMVMQDRSVSLTPAQVTAYKEMKKTMTVSIAQGSVTAANAGVALNKMIQIGCGFVYDDHGKATNIGASHRLTELENVINQTSNKTIVFASHRAAVNAIYNHLTNAGYSAAKVDGSINGTARADIFYAFQNQADPHILVAQERTASHGLTLTEADTIVWYSLPTSYETYAQANARIHRPGQKNKHFVVNLVATPVEQKLLARLKNRESASNLLLEMFG